MAHSAIVEAFVAGLLRCARNDGERLAPLISRRAASLLRQAREKKRRGHGTPGHQCLKLHQKSRFPGVHVFGDFIGSRLSQALSWTIRCCHRSRPLQHGRTVRRVVVPDGQDIQVSALLEKAHKPPARAPRDRGQVTLGRGRRSPPRFKTALETPSSSGDGEVYRIKFSRSQQARTLNLRDRLSRGGRHPSRRRCGPLQDEGIIPPPDNPSPR